MQTMRCVAFLLVVSLSGPAAGAEHAGHEGQILVAAASSVKLAMDGIVARFGELHPEISVQTTYGSSGKIRAQIVNGAPFDLFFSADMAYPRSLVENGRTASGVRPYAVGRLVLWQRGTETPAFADLARASSGADVRQGKLAIANPRHAPYGRRAQEVLASRGLWGSLQPRLVFGENVAQTAQYVQSGAADLGIIPLALALSPALREQGRYRLIDADEHEPLEQGYVLTGRASHNAAAEKFGHFVESGDAAAILEQFGFETPVRQ